MQMGLHQSQIATDMGIPAEMSRHRLHAVVTPAPPATGILASPFQRLLQRSGIGHIHQQAVLTAGLNIARATVIGGDHRQTTGRGLQQRETEWFRQRRVNEQTSPLSCPAVEGRHLRAAMLFRVGDRAVEVVTIDEIEHLLEHIPLLLLHLSGILTAPQHQHKVVAVPQDR